MFKKILYILIPVLSFAIISCEKDNYTGDSTLTPRNSTATITFDLPAEVEENDNAFVYTITVDPPQVVDLNIPVRALAEGTATEGDDFTLDHSLVIPAFTSTASGSLTILKDAVIEGDETVTVQIGNASTANLNMPQTTKTVTITNFESADLDIYGDWGGTVNVGDTDYDLCSEVDIDLYLFDSEDENVYGYDGATANCPEHLTLTGLDDGTYSLYANLWASVVPLDSANVVSYPVSVNFVQGGVLDETAKQSAESAINNLDLDYYEGGSVFKLIAEITVMGDKYSWVMQ